VDADEVEHIAGPETDSESVNASVHETTEQVLEETENAEEASFDSGHDA
jgi:predicted secreted Zn-dependent protease